MTVDKNKQRRLVTTLTVAAIAMFGFCFALVPIYSVFCKVTGLNGKTGGAVGYASEQMIDRSRTIVVQLLTTNNQNLPWDFYPLVKSIEVHPGENTRIAFFARNNTNNTMTVQAIPSVAPGNAAQYLRKTECFCFTRQTFKGHEGREMPVLFHIDPEIPKDVKMISLSYTMFDAGKFDKKTPEITGKIQ